MRTSSSPPSPVHLSSTLNNARTAAVAVAVCTDDIIIEEGKRLFTNFVVDATLHDAQRL